MSEAEQHPIFNENSSQLAMLIGVLDAFPGHRDGVQVPIHPKAREPWAKALLARGVRVHPELMEQLPVAGDHPEAAWMNPQKWVPKAEYAETQEAAASTPEQHREQMRQMLYALNPAELARIEQMSPEEREQERERLAQQLPNAIAHMHEIGRQFIEKQQQAQEEQ